MSGELTSALNLTKRSVIQEQGGLLSGHDPSAYDEHDTIRLWIIQICIIVLTTQLLALGLRRLRQPKVIAEILGGILLGPTAFGRIPGFTKHIFPLVSRPYLSLTANIGLCLFLFLVGLEIESGIVKRNAKISVIVSLAGIIIPFGLGAALAIPLYEKYIPKEVKFAHFVLFTGVAYSITALPVLCRVLTELKMLDTNVGIVVISAGVGNDIIGWILLALSVALVNAQSELTALYILLACIGWALFLHFPVKRMLLWIARKTGSIDNGPTMFYMTTIIILLFTSAFFTDIIGVHAIFGAFLFGIIVPRDGGLAIALTEKLEDMVSIMFLPIYFTLSGLSTDLGLINDGVAWGYTLAICVIAFVGKFGGCTITSRYFAGINWRESSAIGALMSCKGLVELIVLNVGLSAGILTPKVFSMFVIEALALTFITTPLVTLLYPPHMRTRATDSATYPNIQDKEAVRRKRRVQPGEGTMSRFTVVLDKVDHVPEMMSFVQLLQPTHSSGPSSHSSITMNHSNAEIQIEPISRPPPSITVNALRLIELSDRASAHMKSTAHLTLLESDPVLSIFRMFGQLNNLMISGSLAIVQYRDLAMTVVEQSEHDDADMIILPWLPSHTKAQECRRPVTPLPRSKNPFKGGASPAHAEESAWAIHASFVRGVFEQTKTNVALFISQTKPDASPARLGGTRHIFLPFFGGPDDRLALDFVVQLCSNEHTTATVVRISISAVSESPTSVSATETKDSGTLVAPSIPSLPNAVYEQAAAETRRQYETADNLAWSRYTSPPTPEPALARIDFKELCSFVPLHAAIQQAEACAMDILGMPRELLVLTGRSRRLAVTSFERELRDLFEEHGGVGHEVNQTLGDPATAFVVAGCGTGVVVVQAVNSSVD